MRTLYIFTDGRTFKIIKIQKKFFRFQWDFTEVLTFVRVLPQRVYYNSKCVSIFQIYLFSAFGNLFLTPSIFFEISVTEMHG